MIQWIMLAAAALQALNSISSGNQQAAAFKAQAQANDYNAAAMRQRAETERQISGQKEQMQRRDSRIQAGSRRAAMAEAGLGLGGSMADVDSQSEALAELDALNIRYQGELEAHGLLGQASLEEWQANSNRKSASSAKRQGYIGAAGAMLGGYGNYLMAGGSAIGGGAAAASRPSVMGLYGNYSTYRMG